MILAQDGVVRVLVAVVVGARVGIVAEHGGGHALGVVVAGHAACVVDSPTACALGRDGRARGPGPAGGPGGATQGCLCGLYFFLGKRRLSRDSDCDRERGEGDEDG